MQSQFHQKHAGNATGHSKDGAINNSSLSLNSKDGPAADAAGGAGAGKNNASASASAWNNANVNANASGMELCFSLGADPDLVRKTMIHDVKRKQDQLLS